MSTILSLSLTHSLSLSLLHPYVSRPGGVCTQGLDEPLLLGLVDGLRVVGADDGRVRRLPPDPGLCPRGARTLGLVGVVGALVAEHVADQEHQGAQDGEDHHGDDACGRGRGGEGLGGGGKGVEWRRKPPW